MENKYKIFEQGKAMWSILDTAIDGIVIIDQKGTIQIANKAVLKMFGYVEEDIIGKNVKILMPSPDRDKHDQYLHNYNTTRVPQIIGTGREVLARKSDGSTFHIRLAISEVVLDDFVFFTGILHDLTLQKRAEEELLTFTLELETKVKQRTEELSDVINKLLKLNKEFKVEIAERIEIEATLKRKEEELKLLLDKEKEINQMKSRFVSMASHEFRTPLATVLSSASLIEKYTEGHQQENRSRHVKKIRNAVNNLTNILNDFLSLGKLEEGSIAPKPEPFEINAFVNDLVEEISVLLKPGQSIDLTIDDQLSLLYSDPRFLYNSIVNILSNASKYSDENKTIKFSVVDQGKEVVFIIKDQGMGIPEKEQVHLFNRFFRAQNAINVQGTGLGLHIVRRYMDLLNGRITYESELDNGSTFRLHIPKIEQE
jgi:two-component system sensor kinase FixL